MDFVQQRIVADRHMVGLHVRQVFDAPRDSDSNVNVTGASAIQSAQLEYGKEISDTLLRWRKATNWRSFVPKIRSMLREYQQHAQANASGRQLRFYLAADTNEAYEGLTSEFPGSVVITRRECQYERCDFRDCQSLLYAMVDLINLSRTRLILGSGYSSYSEIAAQIGGRFGKAMVILLAGRDFGTKIVERWNGRQPLQDRPGVLSAFIPRTRPVVQHYWPRPF